MPVSSVSEIFDGQSVSITGSSFGYSPGQVRFEDTSGHIVYPTILSWDTTSITCRPSTNSVYKIIAYPVIVAVYDEYNAWKGSAAGKTYNANIASVRDGQGAIITSAQPGDTIKLVGKGFLYVDGYTTSDELVVKNLDTGVETTLGYKSSLSQYPAGSAQYWSDTEIKVTLPAGYSAPNAQLYLKRISSFTYSTLFNFSITAPVPAPSNLTVDNITATSARALWDAVVGASGYRVRLYKYGLEWLELGSTTHNYCDLLNLTPSQDYVVYVYTLMGGQESASPATSTFETLSATLAYPENITVSDQTTTSCFLSWDPVDGATAYRVFITNIDETPDYVVAAPAAAIQIAGLAPNVQYGIYMQSVNEFGGGDISPVTELALIPEAPAGIFYSSGLDYVNIAWDGNPIASYYRIEYLDPVSMNIVTVSDSWPLNSVTVENLQSSTSYLFFVYSVNNSAGTSAPSSFRVTTKTDKPTNLALLSTRADEATITWQPPNEAAGVTGYIVRLYTYEGLILEEHSVAKEVQSYTFQGLSPDTQYKARVATSFAREDLPDDISAFEGPIEFRTLLATPTGLHQTGATTSTIDMEWNEVQGATLYRFRPYPGAGTFPETTTSDLFLQLTGLNTAFGYYIEMRAENPENVSEWTRWIMMHTRPIAPVATGFTAPTPTTLTLNWTAVAADTYKIEYKKHDDDSWTLTEILAWGWDGQPVPITSFTLTGLQPGKLYVARIAAVWPLYNISTPVMSEFSNEVQAYTRLAAPVINITNLEKFSFTASWQVIEGAEAYYTWITYTGGSTSPVELLAEPLTHDFTGLKRNFNYTVFVRAESGIPEVFSETFLTLTTPGAPIISRVLVDDGEIGSFIEIEGANFGEVLGVVLDGVEITLNGYDDTGVDAWAAPTQAGSQLYLITDAGNTNTVTISMQEPPVLSYVPPRLRIGGYYTAYGSNFGKAANLDFMVGDFAMEVTGVSNSGNSGSGYIYFKVPAAVPPTIGKPSVTTNTGGYEYAEDVEIYAVAILTVEPLEGLEGTSVTITGTGLDEMQSSAGYSTVGTSVLNSLKIERYTSTTATFDLPHERTQYDGSQVSGDFFLIDVRVQIGEGAQFGDYNTFFIDLPRIKVLKKPVVDSYSWREDRRVAVNDEVAMEGRYFGQDTGTVTIGGVAQTISSWKVIDNFDRHRIKFIIAEGTPQDAPVVLTTADGRVGYAPALGNLRTDPEILYTDPVAGKAGATVYVVGFNLYIDKVTFPALYIDGYTMQVTHVEPYFAFDVAENKYRERITATITYGVPAGEKDLWVETGAGESNIVPFTVLPYTPEITAPTESRATVSRRFFIFGFDFGPSPGTVLFDDELATDIVEWTDRLIEITIPTIPAAPYMMKIVTAGGESNTWPVQVYEDVPVIEAPTPTVVGRNEQFRIYGANFGDSQGASYVAFGDTVPVIQRWTDREIELSIPVAYSDVLTVHTDKVSNEWLLEVTSDNPVIDGLSRTYGGKNRVVIIFGHDFDISGTAYLDEFLMPVHTWTSEYIIAAVPPGAASDEVNIKRHIEVTTVEGRVSNKFPFNVTYYDGADVIDWDSDNGYPGVDNDGDGYPDDSDCGDGAGGFYIDYVRPEKTSRTKEVTIIGKGFGDYQRTTYNVYIDKKVAKIALWSPEKIVAYVPLDAAIGTVTCLVLKGITKSNVKTLTIIPGEVPVVTGIYPHAGAPGEPIIIEGKHFGEERELGRQVGLDGYDPEGPAGTGVYNYVFLNDFYYATDEYFVPAGVSVYLSKRQAVDGTFEVQSPDIRAVITNWRETVVCVTVPTSVDVPPGFYYVVVITAAGAANAAAMFEVGKPQLFIATPSKVDAESLVWVSGKYLGTPDNLVTAIVQIVKWSGNQVLIKAPYVTVDTTYMFSFKCRNGNTNSLTLWIRAK